MKSLTANPLLIDDEDFGFHEEEGNRKELEKLMSYPHKKIWDRPDNTFLRFTFTHVDWYVMIDKHDQIMTYYSKCERWKAVSLEDREVATQCVVWRNPDYLYTKSLTEKLVFRMYLPKYRTLVSDKYQTRHGMRLWRSIMSQASTQPSRYRIGLLNDKDKTAEWWSPSEERYPQWISARESAWGDSTQVHYWQRFCIELR